MNRTLALSLVAVLAALVYVPAPAAACIADPLSGQCMDVDAEPFAYDNGDGSYTVGARVCTSSTWCKTVSRTVDADVCDNVRICDVDVCRDVPQACDPCSYVSCDPDVCTLAPAACGVDDLCFTYNPDALTNMCIVVGSDSETVTHPTAVPGSRHTCLVGNEVCADHPWATVGGGSTTVSVPVVSGYVEVTACGTSVCRVDLP